MEISKVRWVAKEFGKWGCEVEWCTGTSIEVAGASESLCLEDGRYMGLKKQCADNIIGGLDSALIFAVLGRRVWAREAKEDAMLLQEGEVQRIGELATIVCLKSANIKIKLGAQVCMNCN